MIPVSPVSVKTAHNPWIWLENQRGVLIGFSYTVKSDSLKCICNENFDIGFFAFSENLVFSDHKNTNLVEKFEREVC